MRLAALLTAALSAVVVLAGPEQDQFNFAEGLFIVRDFKSAIEEYEAFLNKFPQAPQAGAAAFRIGESYFRLEDHQKAVTAFKAAAAKYPDVKEAGLGNYNLARSQMKLGNWAEALAAFTAAAAKGEAEVREEALVGQGECLIKLEKLPEAAELYAKFLTTFPQSKHRPEVLFTRGWALTTAGQHEAAVAPLTELLAKHPDFNLVPKAKLALSDAYTALGKYADAKALLDGLLQADKEGEEALLRLAWTMFKSNDKTNAAQTFLAFADKYPQSRMKASALYNAGIAWYDQKQYADAVKVFLRLQKELPQSQEVKDLQFWLGLCHFELKQYADAERVLAPLLADQALPKPRAATLRYTYAEALAAQDRHDDAVRAFDQLLTAYPESEYRDHAAYSKAMAQQKAGKVADAVVTLELLLKNEQTPLREAALFAVSEYLYRLKDPKRALPYLEELTKAGKPSPKALYRLAWVRFELGQFADSRTLFAGLAQPGGEFANEAAYMAGRASESLNETPEAVKHYRSLQDVQPVDEFIEKAFYRLGFLLKDEEARDNFKRYTERFPKGQFLAPLKLKLAENHFAAGQLEPAVKLYGELLAGELTPELKRSALYGMGWCSLKQDQLPAADQYFAQVAGDATEAIVQDALLQRGEIAYKQERYAEAAGFFTKLAGPQAARGERASYMLGWCARRQNQWAASITPFRALLKDFPNSEFAADSAIRLAEALNKDGKFEESRPVLEEALKKPVPALQEELMQLYADTLVALKDWQTTITVCQDLLTKFPESKNLYLVHFRLGVAHKAVGVFDKAEEHFRATIAKTETVEAAQAQFNIGSLYYTQEKYLEAAKNFLRVEMLYDYPELSPKALYHAVDAFLKLPDGQTRAAPYLQKLKEKYANSEWTTKAGELAAAPPKP